MKMPTQCELILPIGQSQAIAMWQCKWRHLAAKRVTNAHLVAKIGTGNSSRRWQNWEVCCCRLQINGWICIFHSLWLVCIGNARSQQVVSTTCVSIHSKSLLLQILHWAASHAWYFAFSGHQWRWKKQTRVNDDIQFWIFWSLNLWFFMLNL